MTAALIIVPLFIVLLAAYLLTIALTSDHDENTTDTQPQVIWTQAGKVAPGNGLMKR